jgi:hypothetical protein
MKIGLPSADTETHVVSLAEKVSTTLSSGEVESSTTGRAAAGALISGGAGVAAAATVLIAGGGVRTSGAANGTDRA